MNSNTAELEIVAPVEAQLVKYAGESGLSEIKTTPIVLAFRPAIAAVRKALADAEGVAASVKDATCVTEIKKAKECRLALRRARIDADKVRKDQKADALIVGRTVDGIFSIIEGMIEPVETALDEAEKTAERAELARKDALETGRKAALAPFVANVALFPLRDMTEPAFVELLGGMKAAKEALAAAAAKAEAERIEREKAEAAERERIRADNARLQQEAIAREAAARAEREAAEKKLAEERAEAARVAAVEKKRVDDEAAAAAAKAAAERAAIEAKARAEREAIEAKARTEREAAAEKARMEKHEADVREKKLRDEREAAELTARNLRNAELARELAESNRKKAEAAAAKKAASAPDREKLLAFASALRAVPAPAVHSEDARNVLDSAQKRLAAVLTELQANAASL